MANAGWIVEKNGFRSYMKFCLAYCSFSEGDWKLWFKNSRQLQESANENKRQEKYYNLKSRDHSLLLKY